MRSGIGTSISQAKIISVAVVVALVLVWISPDARGATAVPKVDENGQGDFYAAGELLVSYDRGASQRQVDQAVEGSPARLKGELSVPGTQLLTFQRGPERRRRPRYARGRNGRCGDEQRSGGSPRCAPVASS